MDIYPSIIKSYYFTQSRNTYSYNIHCGGSSCKPDKSYLILHIRSSQTCDLLALII
ncbi:hypothetical protein Leryth_004600 [Lithospermum erythrorhizon]|nr:hypothetical protein Leryth_004600 [Lithospermum erythrorhizon]